MFGSCYKQNIDKNAVTVYTDNFRVIIFIAIFFMLPIGILLIPNITIYVKFLFFISSSIFTITTIKVLFKYTKKIPLFIISKEGIRPILTKNGFVNPNSKLIKWDNIDKIFIYKAPYSYTNQNIEESGFRYLGIKLINKNETIKTTQPKISPKVTKLIPYSNDLDFPLTAAHPFQKGIIKWLNNYCQQYLEQKK